MCVCGGCELLVSGYMYLHATCRVRVLPWGMGVSGWVPHTQPIPSYIGQGAEEVILYMHVSVNHDILNVSMHQQALGTHNQTGNQVRV